jgi:hypothetical protein
MLHAALFTGLSFVSFTAEPPRMEVARDPGKPTEIRIGDRVYHVSEMPLRAPQLPKPKPSEQAATTTPRKGALTAPAPPAPQKEPSPESQTRAAALPKTFIPPEVRKNPYSDQTLIQPAQPVDIAPPPDVRLPTFRVWTAEYTAPKVAKPFVAPGRKQPTQGQPPELRTPEMAFAEPAPSTNPKLSLPPPPPPVFDVSKPAAPSPTPPSPAGDPVNVLSLNSRPVPISDKLLVPPGNQVGRTGSAIDPAALGEGSGAARSPSQGSAKGAETRAAGDSTGRAGSLDGTPGAKATGSSAPSGDPAAGVAQGKAVIFATGAGPGGGNSSAGAGGAGGGAGVAVANPGPPKPNIPGLVRIDRPANGVFDAVVTQSASPFDLFPESKGLLTGRPIYTVYLAMGTPKDWTLYFCVPGERPVNAQTGAIVAAGSATPVKAPYPTVMLRPPVVLAPGNKYMLVYASISRDGHFQNLKILRHGPAEMDQALITSLSSWEFRAATRDGVPIQVEVLLTVPADKL